MPLKGGSNKACAACKYQRRRCSKDCPLAPYFPADKPKMFSNAHRLFGVSNIMRILKRVELDDRDEAMKSIIFESDIRARFPVGGCYEVILQYQGMMYKTMEELHYMNTLLSHCKQNYSFQQHALPFFPMDHQQYSQPGTSIEFDPIYNNREASSSFDFNLAQSCGESNKEVMIQTPSCTSVITDVNAKPELMMSMQVDTSSANYGINDFNYANSVDSIRCAPESSSNTNYYAMKEAKSNLMLTQGLSYIHDDHEQPDLDARYNIMNVDAKFDLMGKKRVSNYNGLEMGLENVENAAQGRPNAETALGSFGIDARPSCSLGSFGMDALPSCSYRETKQAIDRISEYDGMTFGGEFVDEGQSLDGHESLVECKDALHVNSVWNCHSMNEQSKNIMNVIMETNTSSSQDQVKPEETFDLIAKERNDKTTSKTLLRDIDSNSKGKKVWN